MKNKRRGGGVGGGSSRRRTLRHHVKCGLEQTCPIFKQLKWHAHINQTVVKGPRRYAFDNPSSAAGTAPSPADSSVLKVTLPAALEKSIVREILQFKQAQADYRNVSKRLTAKKLTDLYNSVASVGFQHAQIADGMKNTIGLGGDLHTVLDWLCLNCTNDELPDSFSERFSSGENKKQKTRARFEDTEQENKSMQHTETPLKEEDKKDKSDTSMSSKEWTLRFAESCMVDSSDEEEERDDENQTFIDPNEKYLELSAMVFDAQAIAQECKTRGDSKGQKDVGQKIARLYQEIREIEKHPDFDERVKLSAIAKEEEASKKETQPKKERENKLENEEIEGAFALFDQVEEEKPKEDKTKIQMQKADDVRSFEYTRQTWTGKSPKQFLIDWCRKNHPKCNPPKYQKIEIRGKWKSRVTVERTKQEPLKVCPDILTYHSTEAQHLASVLALYKLCPGQSIHQLLPPPYRDVWLEWSRTESQAKEAKKMEENKPRDQFVTQLLKQVKSKSAITSEDTQENVDELDNWEDLSDEEQVDNPSGHISKPHTSVSNSYLQSLLKERKLSVQYQKIMEKRKSLPVMEYYDVIISQIQKESIVLISGETGSGKSTQIPQFILEDLINSGKGQNSFVVCTQPRRISAVSLANRVSEEMGESGPGSKNSLVGYQIRFESRQSNSTRLLYCTTGVLLRKMQLDPLLKSVTHVIVDEVHERSVQSDFLLIILKNLLQVRKDLKVILMSATMESQKLSSYFDQCPVVKIPGRTFPVEVYHMEDVVEWTKYELERDSRFARRDTVTEQSTTVHVSGKGGQTHKVQLHWDMEENVISSHKTQAVEDETKYSVKTANCIARMRPDKINLELIIELLEFLNKDSKYAKIEGAVLIFLPGLSHIQELHELLQGHEEFSDSERYLLIALHSMLSSSNQSAAFDIPPKGIRKIVLATNIAETGITIPDVVFVIDTGKVKETRYNDQRKISSLEEVFISKASARQRQGRAGRVREGFCFRIFTKLKFESLKSFSKPEIQRIPLEELCLHILKCDFGDPELFLQQALDPPLPQAIKNAMNLLYEVGACTADSPPKLTPLGHHLAALPVNVRVGKMLVFAALFDCLDPVAVIAAALTDKPPFVVPLEKRDEANQAKKALAVGSSDHLAIYKAFIGWKISQKKGKQEETSFCHKNFLSRTNLLNIQNVAEDLKRLVHSSGLAQKVSSSKLSNSSIFLPGTDVLQISSVKSEWEKQALTNENIALIKAVLTAGLYSNVARINIEASIDGEKDSSRLSQAETLRESVVLHPGSVNRNLIAKGWLVFLEKVKQSRIFLRDSSLVSAYPLLLFGGEISVQHREQLICIDDWIQFQAPAKTAVIFKELREIINSLLSRKLAEPSFDIQGEEIIQDILQLLQSE